MIRAFKKRPGNRSVVVFMIGLAGTLAIPFACHATSFRVVHIFDAATLGAINEDRQVKIRLVGISPPPDMEPMPSATPDPKAYLSDMVLDREVDVRAYGYDIHNRLLAVVSIGGTNVNLEMVRAGMARVDPGKSPPGFTLDAYHAAEAEARKGNIGLWGLAAAPAASEVHPEKGPDILEEKRPLIRSRSAANGSPIQPETPRQSKGPGEKKAPDPLDHPETAPAQPSPNTGRPVESRPIITVSRIDFEAGNGSETVSVYMTGSSIPKAFDVNEGNPRIVIDIWNVAAWQGGSRIPVNGKLIRQIRTYLHRKSNKLRIVLDLAIEPGRNYSVTEIYDVKKHIYRLEMKSLVDRPS